MTPYERFKNCVKDEYDVVGEYPKRLSDKCKIIHNECGYVYNSSMRSLVRGKRCPKCMDKMAKAKLTRTHKEFCEIVKRNYGDDFEILSQYTGCMKRVTVKHKCGNITEIFAKQLIDSRVAFCNMCHPTSAKSLDFSKKLMFDLVSDEYEIVEYVNFKCLCSIKHKKCGTVFTTNMYRFKNGKRCPACSNIVHSSNEIKIGKYFESINISFKRNVNLDGCKYEKCLPFDIGVFENDNLVCLIEYDGEQHYRFCEHFHRGGEKDLKFQQIKDNIKNQFCVDNCIPLLRIRYDEDVEQLLNCVVDVESLLKLIKSRKIKFHEVKND